MKQFKFVQIFIVLLIFVAFSATVFALPFDNGSFEEPAAYDVGPAFATLSAGDTTITGWEVVSGSIDWIGPYWVSADGDRSIDLDGSSPGAIQQTFDTVVGETYDIFFMMAGNPTLNDSGANPVKSMQVEVDGVIQEFSFDTTNSTYENMGWVEETLSFTASADTATLTFTSLTVAGGANGAVGVALDNVRIEVSANQAPVAEDFTIETIEDEAFIFNFLDYASDPDGDELTVIVNDDLTVGSLINNEDGTTTFVPTEEWSGTSSFTYYANDGELDSEIATVTIIVLPVNDAPNCDAMVASNSVIWPPNHSMESAGIDESSINDPDSTLFDIALTSISSDEPENGLGDGNTSPDLSLEDATVRGERSGTGDGRTYTISATVDDLDWVDTFDDQLGLFTETPEPIEEEPSSCEGSVEISVPHDMRDKDDVDATICHMPPGNPAAAQTINVGSQSSVDAHLAHGDILGACPEPANNNAHGNNANAQAATANNNANANSNASSNGNGNGNSNGNGKSNDKGNGKGNK